jgi:hypothetical protein
MTAEERPSAAIRLCGYMWGSDVVEVLGGSWESNMYTDSYINHRQLSLRVRYHQFHSYYVLGKLNRDVWAIHKPRYFDGETW